jgi:catechol 2,3-dioxygenase-like lactoylglutathione lyase family enzyme
VAGPPDGAAWRCWLREVVLQAPQPERAAAYYAQLLGGEQSDSAVELGSSTRISIEDGPPGLALVCLDVRGDLDTADLDPARNGPVLDPDCWRLALASVGAIAERPWDTEPRLGHITFHSPDPLREEAFYRSLGFRLSEGLGTMFRWLRCNPIHHTLAFQRAAETGLHHLAIEVPDRAALVDACDRVARLGHKIEFGPGRHLVGRNLFVYFIDRYGLRIEFFAELMRIDDVDADPTVYDEATRAKSVNVWGPQPPETFRASLPQVGKSSSQR